MCDLCSGLYDTLLLGWGDDVCVSVKLTKENTLRLVGEGNLSGVQDVLKVYFCPLCGEKLPVKV